VLAGVAGNYTLRGNSDGVDAHMLAPYLAGVVEAPDHLAPLLEAVSDQVVVWQRVLYRHPGRELPAAPFVATTVRRLDATDAGGLDQLSAESSWISKTWGGPAGLAASGMAWGAWVDARLVSVACTFFVGDECEEIGVATEIGFRGRGLSVACTLGLCRDILFRGRLPTWSTSTDNVASIRVAEKCGFVFVGHGALYVINASIPPAPVQP
jgi:hypothetical protein